MECQVTLITLTVYKKNLRLKKTVVLIDDNPSDLDMMKSAIKVVAPLMKCICLLNSEDAMVVLKQDLVKVPDYIVIDINMPIKNGSQCLRELRNTTVYKNVPIILSSVKVHDEVATSLIAMGATYVFEKPNYPFWTDEFKKIFRNDYAMDAKGIQK